MLRFTLFGFPIFVQPFFWIAMAILGNLNYPPTDGSQLNLSGIVIFTAAGFLSILIHELGHAFSMRKHGGRNIQIQLHGMGGLAAYEPDPARPITRWKQITISAAGPIYQIIAGLLALLVLYLYFKYVGESVELVLALEPFITISLIWGVLNLFIPIFPLDGGQILNGLLGPKNIKITLGIGLGICVALAILIVLYHNPLNLLIIAILASQNIRMLKALIDRAKQARQE